MKRIILKKPPLLETSLSMDFESDPLALDQIRDAVSKVAAEFSDYKPIFENSINIDLTSPAPGLKEEKIWRGGIFKKDGHHILIIRAGGKGCLTIAYSMVDTYTKWEEFSVVARKVIQDVQRKLNLAVARRIGVRCIDRLQKPFEGCQLKDIVKLLPESIADIGDEDMKEFFYRDTKYYLKHQLFATLTRVSQRNQESAGLSYIIDTDVFDFPKELVDDRYLDSLLPRMRELKDELFFGTIGNKALEVCK